ncbi:Os02g0448500 [Oryza sativa Japonica Group]|uniref:Os02g0448500 protein n=1 Tax=Oryza sativa subsp. japonica TaxID=39947 RepID=A0A0P0VIL0_ORYSJ|nr:hypothetical protein EE612_011054 [Oryza sativa]BAS78498.1 Os02g0448500 [Oryza sativa Japonica Group]
MYTDAWWSANDFNLHFIIYGWFLADKLKFLLPTWITILLNYLGLPFFTSKHNSYIWISVVLSFNVLCFMNDNYQQTTTFRCAIRGFFNGARFITCINIRITFLERLICYINSELPPELVICWVISIHSLV